MKTVTRKTRRRDPATELTPVEAAWVADLTPKAVNASIDRGEVACVRRSRRSRGAPRALGPADVIYLVLWKDVNSALSKGARRELHSELLALTRRIWSDSGAAPSEPACDAEVTLAGGIVRIELKTACSRVIERWQALDAAKELVVRDPEIRGGEPIIRGTRIPVYLIADLERQGASEREIAEDFPALTSDMIRAALAYARTHPKRGRPRKAPWKE